MKFSRSALELLLEKTAARMASIKNAGIQEACPIGIIDFDRWEWPQGVGLYGLFKYYQMTKKVEYLELLKDWYAHRMAEGLPEKNVNTMAPMLTLAHLCALGHAPEYLACCGEWAEWVLRQMPRTKDRGLQHIVSGQANEQQLWDDTLFMTVLFLAKMGVLLRRQEYVDEAVRQYLVHIKYLFDRKTGLWFHGWTFAGNHNFANALWGTRQLLDHRRHDGFRRDGRPARRSEAVSAGHRHRAGRDPRPAARLQRHVAYLARRTVFVC